MASSLNRKSRPARRACGPAWCERLSTTSNILLSRPVGLPESVPNDATPAMLIAGPTGSVGSAFRWLYVNCARVSLTVVGDSVQILAADSALSLLSRPADADEVAMPPAPRELLDVTS